MIFEQYYLECLSHASYLIGDTSTGRAVVIDPQRDVSQYLNDAASNGLTITHVIETHFHADFLSGHLEMAEATGAVIVFGRSAEGITGFPMTTYADGERIELGEVVLEIRETPGHTPESISVVVWEKPGDEVPFGVLTGDTLFIGDVGRPDLLSAVGFEADALGRQLYHSLHEKLMVLPDETRVYPAHGAGSSCGKNLSTETVSTIGDQRLTNYALQPMSEEAFVEVVTQGQAAAPGYFLYAATQNRTAHETLDEDAPELRLTFEQVQSARVAGATVIDARDSADFAAGHVIGAINVGLGGRFAEYAGEVVRPGTAIVLLTDPGHEHEARVRLSRIGFDNVVGVLDQPLATMASHPEATTRSSRLSVSELEDRVSAVDGLQLVDVRGPGEVALGSIPGAAHIELAALLNRASELDPDRPTVVFCAGGYRSSIAASLLRSLGFADVSDVLGGYTAWAESPPSGHPRRLN